MHISVNANSNCQGSEEFVFNELGPSRKIKGIRISERGQDIDCEVVGVDAQGRFVDAFAVKVADSGAGFAYMIYGSDWGIRIRPSLFLKEAWNLSDIHQWGEPFKIYGSEEDIIYAEDSDD